MLSSVQITNNDATLYITGEPDLFFSARAIEQRQVQGIAIDELDLPVEPAYIIAVLATGEPLYVTEIVPETNTVVLCRKVDLDKTSMWVRRPNFQKVEVLSIGAEALTKVRYKDKGTPSTLSMDGERVHVEFHAPVAGIAPGQSAVFYDGDDVIGGGFIDRERP